MTRNGRVPQYGDSIQIIQGMLEGALPAVPRFTTSMVDVRDVADLHLRAMTTPAARGERFIAASDTSITLQEIADVLKWRLGPAAARVPTRVLPDWVVRLAAQFRCCKGEPWCQQGTQHRKPHGDVGRIATQEIRDRCERGEGDVHQATQDRHQATPSDNAC
jgi:uncharacterized protein YbjT (DUF2867 family)